MGPMALGGGEAISGGMVMGGSWRGKGIRAERYSRSKFGVELNDIGGGGGNGKDYRREKERKEGGGGVRKLATLLSLFA